MSKLFTLSGCLVYTFTIITTIILVVRLVKATKEFEETSKKALLMYELIANIVLGTLVGILFQNYARLIA